MEKVQQILAHLYQNRFWYLTGIAVLALLGNWFAFNSSLTSARNAATSRIKGKIGEINSVLNVSVENPAAPEGTASSVKVHPNEATQSGMSAEIENAGKSLLAAWRSRREAQEKLFQWPMEVIESPKFIERFAKYDPPEKFPGITIDSDTQNYLVLYKNRIAGRMPLICERINTRWPYPTTPATSNSPGTDVPDPPPAGPGDGSGQDEERGDRDSGGGAGEAGAGDAGDAGAGDVGAGEGSGEVATPDPGAGNTGAAGGGTVAPDNIRSVQPESVRWNPDNQRLWQIKLTSFRGRDGCVTDFPTPYQVLALQQDLWLLEAMFDVIANVNGSRPGEPAVVNDLANIKQIDHVVFGREARAQLGKLILPDERLAGGTAASPNQMGTATPPDAGTAAGTAAPFSAALPDNFRTLSPFHGRYVDANFEPVPVQVVHDALVAPVPPPDHLELIVAKRVPFRIALKMKESAIPAFIAACSNSGFEFEIVQVRVNRHKANDGITAGGSTAPANTNVFGAPRPGSSSDGQESQRVSPETRTNDDVNVEFKGVVRIYNPVDESRIKALSGSEPGV